MAARIAMLGIAVALGMSETAQSQSADMIPAQEEVTFGDLDLGSVVGQATLRRRIQIAAGHVCDVGGMQSLEDFATYSRCVSNAYQRGALKMKEIAARGSGATRSDVRR